MSFLKYLFNAVVQWIFPIQCAYCGREDVWLCTDCIRHRVPSYSENRTCPPPLKALLVAVPYTEAPIVSLIHLLKYNGVSSVAPSLGQLLVHRFEQIDKKKKQGILRHHYPPVVVAVPLHHRRMKERGFNQSTLLAQIFTRHYGLARPLPGLKRVRNTPAQATLSRDERLRNITGAFAHTPAFSVKGKNVILIDDVATTGTTLHECAQELKRAGSNDIYALVIARGTIHPGK